MIRFNKAGYFYVYAVAVFINLVINTYLPIYFYNVLNVDKTQLAFVQLISYFFAFTKPLVAVLADSKQFKKKTIMVFTFSIALTISFWLMIVNLELLLLFGIFTGLIFAFFSIIDVITDKIILETSQTEKQRNQTAYIMQMGGIIGTIAGMGIAFSINFSQEGAWNQYFYINLIFIGLLIPISLLMKSPELLPEKEPQPQEPINKRIILLLCIFGFFAFSDKLFQYPFEPWAVNKYFGGSINAFSLYSIILTLISIPGYTLALYLLKKMGQRNTLITSVIITGIMLMIGPFLDFLGFMTCVAIYLFCGGIILVALTTTMMSVSKGQVKVFQLIAVSFIFPKLILTPLGTFISGFIATELILLISGILYCIAAIPLLLARELE